MKRIESAHSMFAQNILTSDFKNTSPISWDVENPSGTTSFEYNNLIRTNEASLQINILSGYSSQDTNFNPTTSSDYNFTADRTGYYNFSYEVLLKSSGPWFPEVEGTATIFKVSDDSTVKIMNFKWGNNAEPEFSFKYNKFNLYYEDVYLIEGESYRIEWNIMQDPLYLPDSISFNLDSFKLEYITDRAYNVPTIYTQPIN